MGSKLRAVQRNWALYSSAHHRRAALIADKLPKVSAKPLIFSAPAPAAPLGSWTLIAPDRMLAAAACSSPFPNGEVPFIEDRTAPSRAYLKLWELLTLLGERPQPSELCIDLGASPGGWKRDDAGRRLVGEAEKMGRRIRGLARPVQHVRPFNEVDQLHPTIVEHVEYGLPGDHRELAHRPVCH